MLGPGEAGYCISVAPDRELAGIAIDFVCGTAINEPGGFDIRVSAQCMALGCAT
jgi:hypothetical protein